MEHVNSAWNSGEPTFAANSPSKGTPIGKDNFHCTYFRQPKPPCTKNHNPDLSKQYPVSPNLFDTCTDSDSELDELANAEQWLQIPSCSNHCTTGKPSSHLGKKVLGKPVVTFGGTSCSRVEKPVKSCMRKRPIIRGTDNASTKAARFTKTRNYLRPKNDQKEKHLEKLNKTPNSSHKQHGNPMARNNKVLLTERTNNSELMRALSDIRNILHGTKTNPANAASSIEAMTKKRKPVESRIVRNKRLLMSMKNVIRAMKVQEVEEGPGLESLQSIEARNKVAETNLATVGGVEDRGESLSRDRREEEEEMRMPIFMKPQLEKLLNESMRRAVEKYRISGNTWEKLKQEKLLSRNSSEPKNPVSCLFLENHFINKSEI